MLHQLTLKRTVLAAQLQQLHSLDIPYADSFDDRLLIQILLCIAAGERNLVVRVGGGGEVLSAQERKEWVHRVGAEVAWICSALFSLTSHRVHCTTKLSTTAFLRSLFLPASSSQGRQELGGRKEGAKGGVANASVTGLKRSDSRLQRRSLSVPLGIMVPSPSEELDERRSRMSPSIPLPTPPRRQWSTGDPILDSANYPLDDPLSHEPTDDPQESSAGEDLYPGRSLSPRQASPDSRKAARPVSPERRRSNARRHTVNSMGPGRRAESSLVGLGLGDERLPSSPLMRETSLKDSAEARKPVTSSFARTPSTRGPPASPTLLTLFNAQQSPTTPIDRRPSIASVQSGLSYQTAPTPTLGRQPSPPALPQILRSPPSTLSAYPASLQSPTSPTAPSLSSHRQSVEFARSAPPVRNLPQVVILERLERTRPSVQQGLLDVLRERRISLGAGHHSSRRPAQTVDDGSSMRTRRTEITVGATSEGWEGSYNLPTGFLCIAIVCEKEVEEEDGAWGGVSRHLFDRFSLSHTVPSTSFLPSHAFNAPPPSASHPLAPTKPHLSPFPLPHLSLPSDIAPTLQTYAADLLSTIRHHPLLEGRMLTARATAELVLFAKLWVVLSRGDEEHKWEEGMMMLPRDIVSIVMGVVGHRLKMRDAADEKSTFWGSEVGALECNNLRERGVEGVIRAVVGEV